MFGSNYKAHRMTAAKIRSGHWPKIINTDYTALELRALTNYCKRDVLAVGDACFDIYKQLAAEQFDLTVAEVSDELRHLAKVASYDKLYRF